MGGQASERPGTVLCTPGPLLLHVHAVLKDSECWEFSSVIYLVYYKLFALYLKVFFFLTFDSFEITLSLQHRKYKMVKTKFRLVPKINTDTVQLHQSYFLRP